MPDIRPFPDLFLDPAAIKFTTTAQGPSDDIPFIDMDFEVEGDLKSTATVAYSFPDKRWTVMVRQSETDDGSFDFAADATDVQFENIMRAIPEERMQFINEMKAHYDENGRFPGASLQL